MLTCCQLGGPLGTNFSEIGSKYKTFIHENAFEYVVFDMVAILSRKDKLNVYICRYFSQAHINKIPAFDSRQVKVNIWYLYITLHMNKCLLVSL